MSTIISPFLVKITSDVTLRNISSLDTKYLRRRVGDSVKVYLKLSGDQEESSED